MKKTILVSVIALLSMAIVALGGATTPAEACPTLYEPVCGEDGKTYSNACFAEAAGATVAHEGQCVIEQSTEDCQACAAIYEPVCGSDGITYPNSCEAEHAGVAYTEGACTEVQAQTLALGETMETPDEAREAALEYLVARLPESNAPLGKTWTEERTTPEGQLGSESYRYTLSENRGWGITVTYPVVAEPTYTVEITDYANEKTWYVTVDYSGNAQWAYDIV